MYGSHRHAQEQLTFNSFSVAAVATPSSPRRCASAFNSFSVASSRTWEQNVTTDPSLNFQFFLSCFMFPPAGILSAMPLGNLSILSQLLHEHVAVLAQPQPQRHFQFFLSCFESASLAVGYWLDVALSILSQLLPGAATLPRSRPDEAFNSFSVASR